MNNYYAQSNQTVVPYGKNNYSNYLPEFIQVGNIDNSEEVKKRDFSSFDFNNFRKDDGNSVLDELERLGYAVWLDRDGKIGIKKANEKAKKYTVKQSEVILGRSITVETRKSLEETKGKENIINIFDLLLVEGEVFNPFEMKEFFQKNNIWYRNTFHPSEYLMLRLAQYKKPVAIFNLVSHLHNYDSVRIQYFLNWLAFFFQTLKKSQVSILFKGVQGAGKGILFKIIQQLLGEDYCKGINGDSLGTKYFGAFIENLLFINFDEMSHQTTSKGSVKSFLKGFITNDSITAEKKNIDLANPTKLYAQCLLFSNEAYPIEIEPSDRRFTVFTTGGSLADTNFLGYGDYLKLEQAIMEELRDFALYLKSYIVDYKTANSVFLTSEKVAMMYTSENTLREFVNAIKNINIPYFQVLQIHNHVFYNDFIHHLTQFRVKQKHLIFAYRILYPYDQNITTSRTLLKHLEKVDPYVFGDPNLHKSNGDKYYRLTF